MCGHLLPLFSEIAATQRRIGCRCAGGRAHQCGRVRSGGCELGRLTTGRMETSNDEPGAQTAQLSLIRRTRRHDGGGVHPQQMLLPHCRASSKREHVMDPGAMTTSPTLLAGQPRSHRNVPDTLTQRPVSHDRHADGKCTQPQRHTQQRENRPDHRYFFYGVGAAATWTSSRAASEVS